MLIIPNYAEMNSNRANDALIGNFDCPLITLVWSYYREVCSGLLQQLQSSDVGSSAVERDMQLPADHKHTLGPGEKPLVFPEIERMYVCQKTVCVTRRSFAIV